MYWNNLEVDTRAYPVRCPGCDAEKWQDTDWETGLVYCFRCGWYEGDDDTEEGKHSWGPRV